MNSIRVRYLFLVFILFALSAVSCSASESKPTITIASKDFTEQFIVAEMYAQVLENAGYPVERKLNLGSTPVAHQALVDGEIDLYPEYTGTGLLTVLKLPVVTDPQQVFDIVSLEYRRQFNLTWLKPAPMNNTQAIAMTQDRAAELGISTISDLVAKSDQVTMAGPIEFLEREDGYIGLQSIYGSFDFAEYRPIDPGLRYTALSRGDVDAVVAFGTDGQIEEFSLLLLEDDRQFWPPYQLAPVIQTAVTEANPEITTLLNELSPLLTNETMQRLNNEVSGNGQAPADVARTFLIEQGLIDES